MPYKDMVSIVSSILEVLSLEIMYMYYSHCAAYLGF